MARRKYTRFGEKSQGDECTNKNCKWQGLDKDKARRKIDDSMDEHVCPRCGNNEFYGLLEFQSNE